MEGDNVETFNKWIGEVLDMEAEFDDLDKGTKGQIFFEDMVKWALRKNMKIKLLKREEKGNVTNGKKEKEE